MLAIPIKHVEINSLTLEPRGGTALLDAVGITMKQVGARLAAMPEWKRPGKVVILVITDGEENSSREYTKQQVRDMVKLQQDTYKWDFIFLGADIDAFDEGSKQFGTVYANTLQFDKKGTRNTWSVLTKSVSSIRSGLVGNSVGNTDYFNESDRIEAVTEDETTA